MGVGVGIEGGDSSIPPTIHGGWNWDWGGESYHPTQIYVIPTTIHGGWNWNWGGENPQSPQQFMGVGIGIGGVGKPSISPTIHGSWNWNSGGGIPPTIHDL